MKTASQYFGEAERREINDCVRVAEAQTSAEIVPVVATSSGNYDRAEDIAGLWAAVTSVMLTNWFWPQSAPEVGAWGGVSWGQRTAVLGLMTVVGFLCGVVIGSRWRSLRRLLTPTRQLQDQVRAAAGIAFFDQRVHHTASSGGLLFYVSLEERIAVILADSQVLTAIGQTGVDELCQLLTGKLRSATPCEALSQAIRGAGQRLATALPRSTHDVNELPDALITID